MEKEHRIWLNCFFIVIIICICVFFLRTHNTHVSPSPQKIEETISIPALSIEETVGQLFVWGIPGTTLSTASSELIKNTHPAGVILMGEFTKQELKQMTDDIKNIPTTLPLFIAIDEEGGTVKHLTDDTLPGGRVLGLLTPDAFCKTVASRSALLQEGGINTNFGIIGDIGWNNQAYMWQRTYADTPTEVAEKVAEAIRCSNNSISVIKHFPGHGDTPLNSHFTIPDINKTEKEWRQEDGLPFLRAIEKDVDMIMVGHIRYPTIATEPASLSKPFHNMLINDDFRGITITDDLGMLEQSGYTPTTLFRKAIDAGNNLLLVTTSSKLPEEIYADVLTDATQSSFFMEAIKQSVDKTLQCKFLHLPM